MQMLVSTFWESALAQSERPLFIQTLSFPASARLLVLAPHPDDFDAIGVTMRHFRDKGNPIDVGVVTSGASGVEDSFCTPSTLEMKALVRESEQQESCRFFGLPEDRLTFLRLLEDDSGHPIESDENVGRIRRYLIEKQPEVVFLPHGNDSNPGHQHTHSMLRTLATELGFPQVAFLNRDPKTIEMRDDAYMVFGETEAAWKAELLRNHRSQHQRNLNTRGYGFDERILRVNREIAAKYVGADHQYAEAFEVELFAREEPHSRN